MKILNTVITRLAPVLKTILKIEPSELDWLQVYDDTLTKNCYKDWSRSKLSLKWTIQTLLYQIGWVFCQTNNDLKRVET